MVHNFKLINGESYTFGHFEGNIINSADCLLVEICLQHSSFSCRWFKLLADKKSRS